MQTKTDSTSAVAAKQAATVSYGLTPEMAARLQIVMMEAARKELHAFTFCEGCHLYVNSVVPLAREIENKLARGLRGLVNANK